MLKRLWQDECGLMHSVEYILLIVIAGIGMIVGLATFRDQLVQELGDTGVALENLDQSYIYVVPGAGYDPAVPYVDPMTPGYNVSIYDASVSEPAPPTDPANDAPGGIVLVPANMGTYTQNN